MNDPQSPTPTPAVPSANIVPAERGLQWLLAGWRLFLKAPGVWLGITVFLLVAFALIGSVPLFGQFAIAFLMPVVVAGLLSGCRALEQGEALQFTDLFAGFRQDTGNLVTIGVLSLLGHGAIFLVVLALGGGAMLSGAMSVETMGAGPAALDALKGALLALLVGTLLLLPLAMALWFAPALVMFDGMAPVATLKISFIGCLKNTLPFLIYGIVGLVLLLLVIPTFGLGLLILIPVVMGSVYASYRDIYVTGLVTGDGH